MPLARVIHDKSGITKGLRTTVHANHCYPEDYRQPLWETVMTAVGLPKISSLHLIAPLSLGSHSELNRMLTGLTFHILIPNMPMVDLTCHLEKADKCDDSKKAA